MPPLERRRVIPPLSVGLIMVMILIMVTAVTVLIPLLA